MLLRVKHPNRVQVHTYMSDPVTIQHIKHSVSKCGYDMYKFHIEVSKVSLATDKQYTLLFTELFT